MLPNAFSRNFIQVADSNNASQPPTFSTPMSTRIIYVFGSNLAGRHGKGSALTALQHHGAVYGQGEGLQGDSYGIPTKDQFIQTRPLARIALNVEKFVAFALAHPQLTFHVDNIGCLNAGYTPEQVAPLFTSAPENCFFKEDFAQVLRSANPRVRTWSEKTWPQYRKGAAASTTQQALF